MKAICEFPVQAIGGRWVPGIIPWEFYEANENPEQLRWLLSYIERRFYGTLSSVFDARYWQDLTSDWVLHS